MTVVYLYYPFQRRSYNAFFNNLKISLQNHPRKIKIITQYYPAGLANEMRILGEAKWTLKDDTPFHSTLFSVWKITDPSRITIEQSAIANPRDMAA